MGAVGYYSGWDGVLVTSQRPSNVFRFLLSTGVPSELKILALFFVKIA